MALFPWLAAAVDMRWDVLVLVGKMQWSPTTPAVIPEPHRRRLRTPAEWKTLRMWLRGHAHGSRLLFALRYRTC